MSTAAVPDLVDATGVRTAVAGELLLAVGHLFTPEATLVARLAQQAREAGKRCRVVSVDSEAAFGAWLASIGADVPVGSDPDGALARRLGRFDDREYAWRPGWVQLGRDGGLLAAGDDPLPPALRAFLGARPTGPVAAPAPARRALPWWGPALGVLLVAAGAQVWWSSRPPPSAPPPRLGATPGGAAPAPAPEPAAEDEALPASEGQERVVPERARLDDGWFAVPGREAGRRVRVTAGVLEVEGAPETTSACHAPDVPLTTALRISGSWALDAVGGPETKGARVTARLVDASGRILPGAAVEGGALRVVAHGRRSQDWRPFELRVEPTPGAAAIRVCVDNRAGSGVVRVKGLDVAPA